MCFPHPHTRSVGRVEEVRSGSKAGGSTILQRRLVRIYTPGTAVQDFFQGLQSVSQAQVQLLKLDVVQSTADVLVHSARLQGRNVGPAVVLCLVVSQLRSPPA